MDPDEEETEDIVLEGGRGNYQKRVVAEANGDGGDSERHLLHAKR